MALALAPQCCCGRPGFLRDLYRYAYAFVHPSELDQFGRLTTYARWMVPSRYGEDYAGSPHSSNILSGAAGIHVMGYDAQLDRLYFGDSGASAWYSSDGGVSYLVLGDLVHGNGTPVSVIDRTRGQAILAGSDPTGLEGISLGTLRHLWSAYSDGRLYGFTKWLDYGASPGTKNFKAWSVAIDGSDYTEHFSEQSTFQDYVPAPYSLTVMNGDIYTIQTWVTGQNSIDVSKNGSVIASAVPTYPGPPGIHQNLYPEWLPPLSCTELHGQLILFNYNTGAVHLFDGGWRQLEFVALENGQTVEYVATGLGYDNRANATVVVWEPYNPLALLRGPAKYVTYLQGPVTTGNLVGQPNVRIYATFLAGSGLYAWPSSPAGWGVVLPGRMPEPLEVVAGVIEPPPPPPPPGPPDCSQFNNCPGTITGNAIISELVDVHDGPGVDASGNAYTDIVWTYANFNRGYNADKVFPGAGVPPGSWCTTSGTGLTHDFWQQLGTQSDYNNPGILLRYTNYPNANLRDEVYVYGIGFGLKCVEGKLTLEKLLLAVQRWNNYDPTSTTWPDYFGPLHQSCVIPSELVLAFEGMLAANGCESTTISSRFACDNWLSGLTGNHTYMVWFTVSTSS